jgi:hypothetical protein
MHCLTIPAVITDGAEIIDPGEELIRGTNKRCVLKVLERKAN